MGRNPKNPQRPNNLPIYKTKSINLKRFENTIPESKLFCELSAYEKRLDSILLRRQQVIHDTLSSVPAKTAVHKKLKLVIYNNFNDQGGIYHTDNQAHNSLIVPSWTLRIEGYLVEDTMQKPSEKKFTSFFKKIFIQLDPEIYPEDNIIEWDRTQDSVESDGFEIHRKGDQECNIKIFLHLAYSPPRYKLSTELIQLLKVHTDTRPRILVALWRYIKYHKLQDASDRKIVNFNKELQQIFNRQTVNFSEIPELLREHLGPPDPIVLDYKICLSGEPNNFQKVYDIHDIPVSENTQADNLAYNKEIASIDAQISDLVEKVNQHRENRDFMVGFALNPVEFINNIVASQIHDWKLMHSNTDGEFERLSEFYQQPLTQEAVGAYLSKIGTDNLS